MSPVRYALTGVTGMIGRRIADALVDEHCDSIGLMRDHHPEPAALPVVRGDLHDVEALADLLDGRDVLIHAASYVGDDERLQQETNVAGTELLYRSARRAGVRRIVYVSTAGVYGGPFSNGGTEAELIANPRSALSASRRQAELLTLEHGGTVLRPGLVTGEGDRWFLLPLIRAMTHLGGWVGTGEGRVSWIDSRTLGRVAVEVARNAALMGVYHAAYDDPARIRDLVTPIYAAMGTPAPSRTVPVDVAATRLSPLGVPRRSLDMVTRDRWFDSSRLWRELPALSSSPQVMGRRDLNWYLRKLDANADS